VLVNIINQYRSTKQYEKVIEQASSAISFATEIGDSLRLAMLLNSLGMAYKNVNQIEKSLETLHLAEAIFDKKGDDFRKAYILINIGGVYDYVQKRNLSLDYYFAALKIFNEKKYVYGKLNALTGIAGVYEVQQRDQDARTIYSACIDTAQTFGFNDIILESYLALANIEYKLENYKKAYDFKEKYNILNDSIFSVEQKKQYAELQTRYETVQKENEINLLHAEKLIRENELRRNRLFNWIAITFSAILIIFIYIGFIYYNQKRKANALLLEKNNQIESKNIQLHQMNEQIVQINEKLQKSQIELTNSNNAKNRFFSILGHDLRNPFHSIMGESYLLSKSYEKLSVEERKKYANDILNSCEQVNRLLDNLMEWIRTQMDGIVFNPKELEFYQLVQDSVSILKNNAQEKSINIVNTIDRDIKLTADYPMLETIMRNIINNGIKFTPEGGTVTISAELTDHSVQVDVADTGVGIPSDALEKLFNVDSNIKTRGTNNERGTGLGLVICKEFINYHNGKLWAESEPGNGTIFHFSIPVTR
jgi:signal transduction histidine kinase